MDHPNRFDKGFVDIARLFLFKHSRGDVVRDSDISKFKARYHKIDTVLTVVNSILEDTFGLSIKYVDRLDKEGRKREDGRHGIYTLQSKLDIKEVSRTIIEKRGLLISILAFIRLKGGKIDEQYLFQRLEKIGLSIDSSAHPSFGNVRQFISKNLVSDQYLHRCKIDTNDDIKNQRFEYQIGGRSQAMIENREIESFIHEIMTSPRHEN